MVRKFPLPHELSALGWSAVQAAAWPEWKAQGLCAGRVVDQARGQLRLATAVGEVLARIPGRLRHHAETNRDLPTVGDWVAYRAAESVGAPATVVALLPRTSAFVRKAAGERSSEQVVAGNVDTVFLAMGLDGDFNLRRLERYLALAWESGALPVVILTKRDLAEDPAAAEAEVHQVASGVDVFSVCGLTGEGLEALERYLGPGRTIALLGSSGVGKSTLLNGLLGGRVQKTAAVRAHDQRGRHTTTHREIFVLPGGALVIDTPGLREIQLWEGDEGLNATFEDVEGLAAVCRFGDCRHESEPGCAVLAALEAGELPPERLTSYRKLQAEQAALGARLDEQAKQAKKRLVKVQHKALHRFQRERGR